MVGAVHLNITLARVSRSKVRPSPFNYVTIIELLNYIRKIVNSIFVTVNINRILLFTL